MPTRSIPEAQSLYRRTQRDASDRRKGQLQLSCSLALRWPEHQSPATPYAGPPKPRGGAGGGPPQPRGGEEVSVEDRACITAAAAKLPNIATLKVERSRALPQPSAQGRRDPTLSNVKVEIDVSVAGQSSTYVFNCVRQGQLVVVQPMGMR